MPLLFKALGMDAPQSAVIPSTGLADIFDFKSGMFKKNNNLIYWKSEISYGMSLGRYAPYHTMLICQSHRRPGIESSSSHCFSIGFGHLIKVVCDDEHGNHTGWVVRNLFWGVKGDFVLDPI
jgi:hypothetical protein